MQRRGELPSLTEKSGQSKQAAGGGKRKAGKAAAANSSKHLDLAAQLLEAVRQEKPRIVKRLLDNKINMNATNQNGETPLQLACAASSEEARGKMVAQLLSSGCSVNACDNGGRTALMRAVACGDPEVVRILLDNQADAGLEDSQGDNALCYAARVGNTDLVRRLVREARRAKRDIDHKNMRGLTALLIAAREGHADAAKILAEEGNASLTVRDLDNFMTAEEWLLEMGYKEDEVTFVSPKARRRNRWAHREKRTVKTLSDYIAEEKGSRSLITGACHPLGACRPKPEVPTLPSTSLFREMGNFSLLHNHDQSGSSGAKSMFDFPSYGTRKKSHPLPSPIHSELALYKAQKYNLYTSPYLSRRNNYLSPNKKSKYYTEGSLDPISDAIPAAHGSRQHPKLSRTHSIDEGSSEFQQQPSLPPLKQTNSSHKQ